MTKPVKLQLIGPKSQIFVGDTDIAGSVSAVAFTTTAQDRIIRLTLDLVLLEAEIEGEAVVKVAPSTHQALVALGWTPPAE
jgi:hypothetical protein